MPISEIQKLIATKNYKVTAHAIMKMAEREIDIDEVEESLLNGEIIEKYMDDKYSPSCLIVGRTSNNRPLHVVCSLPPKVWLITTYEPNDVEWVGYKFRRKR